MTSTQHYTFGDSDVAAMRLGLLAELFAPSSSKLLSGQSVDGGIAVDLGSGPGHSTELLHAMAKPFSTYGVERSPRLVALARARTRRPLEFVEHDVARTPFPVPKADLLYVRFLLTHLRDPGVRLFAWTGAVVPGGRLVIEENTSLESEHPAFRRYYECVERLQSHYGQQTFIGLRLDRLCEDGGWIIESSETQKLELPASKMARLHALNLRTWGSDPFARASYDPRELATLRDTFDRVAEGEESAPPVVSGVKQLVLASPERSKRVAIPPSCNRSTPPGPRADGSGDGLHPSPAGYQKMADSVDLTRFTK